MMNGKSKVWALALLAGVFLLGGVTGAAVDRMWIGASATSAARERGDSDNDRRRGYIEWLSGELGLTEEQRAEVEVIVERHRGQLSALWREMRPSFEELKSQLRDEIREVLTEEQLKAYEALIQDAAERHHNNNNRGRR